MIIKSIPAFEKVFRELSRSDQQLVRETIFFFRDDPHHPSLRNHPLRGSMLGKRSISVSDDIRIIFIEKGDYVTVLMLDVGNHLTVYTD